MVEARGEPGNLDSLYVYDPALIVPGGAILSARQKGRLGEPEALRPGLEAAGVPILGRLKPPATANGGDTVWLDDTTLLVGRSYRTNDVGIETLRSLLPEAEVLAFDLPHVHGRTEVLHLRSLLNPISPRLAVAFLPLLPARLVELLQERGIRLVEVPEDEFVDDGAKRPRDRWWAPSRRTRRQRRHAAAHGGGWGRGARLRGRRDLAQGRRWPACLTLPL